MVEDFSNSGIKLSLIGSSQSGKSSILSRFLNHCFSDSYKPTIGVEFQFKQIPWKGKSLSIQAWDTSGDASWRSMTLSNYIHTQGFLIVYSLNDRNSFEEAKIFISLFKSRANNLAYAVLIGNKCDLKSERQVSYEEGKQLADENEILYLETSAKNGINVHFSIKTLCETVILLCK
ncbi:rab1_4 [Blepharisma stoltei]|uniref:Uncharacterized protein n=1 Tax=Blepharisma stoltei TaxID=1481888 RepID=A0AAU9J2B1_9CILI|nr:unnamed protein product [Blepharisma stoltei]